MPNNPFVVRDKVSCSVEDTIRLSDIRTVPKTFPKTFHPDELTKCGRKVLYGKKEYQLPFTSMVAKAEYYNDYYVKLKWINLLKRSSDIKVLDCWVVANDMKYNVVTKIDCVIEIPNMDDLQIVVYIKSLPSEDFANIKKNGATREDTIRVMTDMWLIEIINGIIIYENRDNLDFIIYRVLPQNAVINGVKAKAEELYEHKINGTTPPKPYKSRTSKECQECEFHKRCWL